MNDVTKKSLVTLIKTVVSALIVFGSSLLSQFLGTDSTIVGALGASVGTAVLVS